MTFLSIGIYYIQITESMILNNLSLSDDMVQIIQICIQYINQNYIAANYIQYMASFGNVWLLGLLNCLFNKKVLIQVHTICLYTILYHFNSN